MVKVSVVRCERPDVKGALELIDFTPGDYDLVAVKPNLCAPLPYYTGATTDLRMLEEVIKIFKPCAEELVVMEGNGFTATADEAAEKTGVLDVCSYFDVPFVNLSKDIAIPVKGELKALRDARIPRTYLKADLLVNLPVMKTHTLTTVSLGMKNLLGILPGRKSTYHSRLSDAICDIARIRKPDLTIMDAIIGMEGEGPISGSPKKMGLVLASEDILALDITACQIMRVNPVHVDHLQKAAYYGLGESNPAKIEVVGEQIPDVWDRFIV
ncbi:MAG: DUF362 domain-containing protein [Methanobacteriota archaeon]|nr:MAG: DUF362 domain-containing protein [Euryarchaeota archaeon]